MNVVVGSPVSLVSPAAARMPNSALPAALPPRHACAPLADALYSCVASALTAPLLAAMRADTSAAIAALNPSTDASGSSSNAGLRIASSKATASSSKRVPREAGGAYTAPRANGPCRWPPRAASVDALAPAAKTGALLADFDIPGSSFPRSSSRARRAIARNAS